MQLPASSTALLFIKSEAYCVAQGAPVKIKSVHAEVERERGDVAECTAQSAQQKVAELEAVLTQQAQRLHSLSGQVSTDLSTLLPHWQQNASPAFRGGMVWTVKSIFFMDG